MDRWLKALLGFGALAALAAWFSLGQQPAGAQVVVRPQVKAPRVVRPGQPIRAAQDGDAEEESLVDGVFVPPDRTAKRRLEMAKEMIDDRRYGESVRYLGSLLEGSEDYFFKPDPSESVYRSLKAEAGRLIAAMPADGRESYELQFGAKARRMLEEASAAGDPAQLAEVSRRFLYTKAGAEATLLLARNHLDHGRPLAAALLLERLGATPEVAQRFEPMLSLYQATAWLRAGMPEKAQVVLIALKRERPQAEVRMGGKNVKLFQDDAQAIAWLEEKVGVQRAQHVLAGGDWLMYRGDARRNAVSDGGRPLLNPRWKVRVAHHPKVTEVVTQLQQAYASRDIAALPGLFPLAVGNVVLLRNTRSLLAVDFETGKLIWEAEPLADVSIDQLLAANSQPQQFPQLSQLMQFFDQRVWDDPTYGTMSSDGEQVYVVEDLGIGVTNQPMIIRARGQRQMSGVFPKTYNRLTARELKTEGKLKWEVGGQNGEDEPKLAGAFFLGPPLTLHGRLYALAEMKGQEIRLVVLSASTGKLEWSQQLCVVEQNIAQDSDRRAGGATPSFADGVLICPTSAGAVVAVDATTRSLLWGYQYPRNQQGNNVNRLNMLRMGGMGGMFPGNERRTGDRWVDGTATIVDGNVLITPIESEHLYCLNLLDGQVKWKLDRENSLYVAGVHAGNVIVVGHNQVNAYRLANGEKAWAKPLELPAGSIPSGRGFLSGHNYYLPLSSAEVAEIDLNKGEIVSRAKSRSGDVPGNLICHRGEIISQAADNVETFYQLDSLKDQITERLKQAPDDPKALARLGEIKLDEGNLNDAIGLFRRSFDLAADDYTRGLLVDSLLEGLRSDFATNRAQATELEKLIDQKQQRHAYLRLVAVGLKKAGETLPAFDTYMRLLDDATEASKAEGRAELEAVGDSLLVRRDRWLQAELGDLRAHAQPADQKLIDERVAARLNMEVDVKSAANLRRFLKVFGAHPLADDARERLAGMLSGAGSMIERELLLRRLQSSRDEVKVRAAVARLAALYDEAKRPDLAVMFYRQLGEAFANQPCLDGKTGQQLVDALPAEGAVRKALAGTKAWPAGRIVANDKDSKRTLSGPHHQRSFDLNLHGITAPFFSDMTVTLDPQQQTISGQDGLGNERFKAVLHEQGNRRTYGWNGAGGGFNNPMLNYVSVNGNLLLMWMGHQVLAVDTLRSGEASSRVLWSQELNEQVPGVQVQQGFHQRPVNVPWGLPRFVAQDSDGRLIGSMGPVNFDGVCFQKFRDLVCADPLSGDVLWTRKNVPSGSDVFGDDEMLFVAPPEGGDALVLRALDGELLGRRPLAALEQRMLTLGRQVLVWDTKETKQVITLRDAWSGAERWSFAFEGGAKGAVVGNESVGVLEPSGRFVLVRLADGQKIVEAQLEPENSLTGIYLMRSADQYLLMTNSPPANVEANLNIQPAPGGLNNPIISGRLYAFDSAAGKALWPKPVSIEQRGLVLTQPSELPLLFFLSHRHRATPAGQHETKTAVLCVDKRNGRVVYKTDTLPLVINNFEVVGDRSDNTVSLLLPGKTISFKLTDEPPLTDEEQAKANKKGILEAFGDALKRSVERQGAPPGDAFDDD